MSYPSSTTIAHVEPTAFEECFQDDDDENDSAVATIALSCADEVPIASYESSSETDRSECTSAASEDDNEESALEEAELIPSCSLSEEYETYKPSCHANERAEYISATFHRLGSESLGLKFKGRKILSIAKNSPAATSPLQVGDKLMSINKICCDKMTSVEMSAALKAPGMMTLVVQNTTQSATSNVVESMFTKSSAEERIGLGLRKSSDGGLKIGSIQPHMAAAQTLLNKDDYILAINGIPAQQITSTQQAKDIIASSESTVTLKVLTTSTTATVLGEVRELSEMMSPLMADEEQQPEETTSTTTNPAQEAASLLSTLIANTTTTTTNATKPLQQQQRSRSQSRSRATSPSRAFGRFRSAASQFLRDENMQQRIFGMTTTAHHAPANDDITIDEFDSELGLEPPATSSSLFASTLTARSA